MRQTDFEKPNPSQNWLKPRVVARKLRSLRFRARAALGRGALPNTLIIGAMKCGTTSLFAYLVQHPDVSGSRTKELHFLDNQFHLGERWYRANFTAGGEAAIVESSPYYFFHPLAARRAAETVPDARLVLLLRNPVDRAYSHYNQNFEQGLETLSFEEALAAEDRRLAGCEADLASSRIARSHNHQTFSYVAKGLYARQLVRWLEFFPRERLLIMKSEDMFAFPQRTMNAVTDYLGLERFDVPDLTPEHGRSYAPMGAEARERLNRIFEEPNRQLERLTGIGWTA